MLAACFADGPVLAKMVGCKNLFELWNGCSFIKIIAFSRRWQSSHFAWQIVACTAPPVGGPLYGPKKLNSVIGI